MKCKGGIYGYEPVTIQLAESRTIPEDGMVKVFTFGHAVEESKLRLLIKFTVYYLVEKDEGILSFLKYFMIRKNNKKRATGELIGGKCGYFMIMEIGNLIMELNKKS